MAESLEDYAEDYHEVQAEAAAVGDWMTAWVRQVDPPAEGRDAVYILLDIGNDLAVLRLPATQLTALLTAYPDLVPFFRADAEPAPVDLQVRAAVDEGGMQLADVADDGFNATEPDVIVTEVGHDPAKLDAMYRDAIVEAAVTRAQTAHDRPPRVEVSATTTDDALCIHATLAATTDITETVTWEYVSATAAGDDQPTRTLIETLGGGDPRFIDGEAAYIMPIADCDEPGRIQTNRTGSWGLVPPQLYEDWQTQAGVLDRVRTLLGG